MYLLNKKIELLKNHIENSEGDLNDKYLISLLKLEHNKELMMKLKKGANSFEINDDISLNVRYRKSKWNLSLPPF